MSDASVLENPSFEEKINDISDYLKNKVLDPAEKEKENIVSQANQEKEKIINDAKKEAEKIISDAKSKAEHELKTLESSLRIASKQAVDSLKLVLEKEVLKQTLEEPANKSLNSEAVLKDFIAEVINIYMKSNEVSDLEVVLSDNMKSKLKDYIKSQAKDSFKDKIALSTERIPSGFSVVMKDKGMMFDFSQESIVELLSDYLRPELRKFLFEK